MAQVGVLLEATGFSCGVAHIGKQSNKKWTKFLGGFIMRIIRRMLLAFMCAAIMLSVMTACGTKSETSDEYDSIAVLTDNTISASDVVLTVNGEDVSASFYFYWLRNAIDQVSLFYDVSEMDEDFDTGQTVGEYIKSLALSNSVYYTVILQEAEERQVELTDLQTQQLDYRLSMQWDEEQYLYYATTESAVEKVYTSSYLFDNLKDTLYGDDGDYEITEEDILEYIGDAQYYTLDYMFFAQTDDGEDAAQKAQDAYDALAAAGDDDYEDVFTDYASESGVYEFNATILSDSKGEEFESVVAEMEEGDMIVYTTDSGSYVITKRTLNLGYFESNCIDTEFQQLVYSWQDAAEVVTNETYDLIDMQTFYDNLMAAREGMNSDSDDSGAGSSDVSDEDDESTVDVDVSSDVEVNIISG